MYLYKRNEGKIEVYTLVGKPLEISKYKEYELRRNELKFYTQLSNECPKPLSHDALIMLNNRPVQEKHLNNVVGNWRGDNTLVEDKSADIEKFIRKYIQLGSNYDSIQIVTKNDSEEILYRLLLTNRFYDYNRMDGIVDLPEKLYLLNLLEKAKLNELGDKEISDQLKLFTLSLYDRLSIDELKRGCDCQLIPGCYNGLIQKVEETEQILRKIK